jgi:thioredoxin-related protein
MKKIYLIFPLAIILVLLAAMPAKQETTPTTSIKFHDGTWASALEKAKAQNKPIFLDASTSWCGWCKRLKATTFTDKTVADYFNKNYINVEIDAEHGEGLQLAQKYRISNFPTLIFIDKNEKVLMFSEGFLQPTDLLNIAKQVVEKKKK